MPELREARNLEEFQQREALVERFRKLRAEVVLELNTIEYWNRTHPLDTPIDVSFERATLAWIDGKGPMPELPTDGATDAPR